MYTVYVLRSMRGLYVGYTTNMRQRLEAHNKGSVPSTKPFRPWRLIFCECYVNKDDALRREQYLKTTMGKRGLKLMLRETLHDHELPK